MLPRAVVQGVLATVGDCAGPNAPVHVPMIPAWISLGDHDNILYYRKLGHLNTGAIAEPSSMDDVADYCFGFGPEAFEPDALEELDWPHHDPVQHGPIDPQMDPCEASFIMLNSVLLDLPAGTKIALSKYNLERGYSNPPLAVQHYRLKVAPDTAELQKTMHKIMFNDHREAPTERVWLPGGDEYGDYQLEGMQKTAQPITPGLHPWQVDPLRNPRRCCKDCNHSIAPGRTGKGNAFDTCAFPIACTRAPTVHTLQAPALFGSRCCRECATGGAAAVAASAASTNSTDAAAAATPASDTATAASTAASTGTGTDTATTSTDAAVAAGDTAAAAPSAAHSSTCLRRQCL